MNKLSLKTKVFKATKWALITEVVAKLIIPITNMILARLLVPEAFGVLTTVIMIISFAEMFADAGFQKYLIQHEFKNDEEKNEYTNVAFFTNFIISIFLWLVILIFSKPIAIIVGHPGLEMVIVIACLQLPLTAFSSVQVSLYEREFDFKSLFLVRTIAIFIPFFVTIPLALLGFSYWSLIIGNFTGQISNAIILTYKSKWKPQLYFSIKKLKNMLSFSIWSLIESISIWFTAWIDIFIIGSILDSYYLGIYRTSTSMVNSLLAIITSATVPVLFSTLSRLQNRKEQFNQAFFNTQKNASVIVYPLSVGVFLYSDLATQVFLGSRWTEASGVIAHWALTSGILIVNGYYCSEVYRAKGRPKLSFISQILHLIVLVPVCIYSAQLGFWALVLSRSWIRLQGVLVDFLLMRFCMGISIIKMITNTIPTAICAFAMGVVGYFLKPLFHGITWTLISIMICALFYFGVLCIYKGTREQVFSIIFTILGDFGIQLKPRQVKANFKKDTSKMEL